MPRGCTSFHLHERPRRLSSRIAFELGHEGVPISRRNEIAEIKARLRQALADSRTTLTELLLEALFHERGIEEEVWVRVRSH